MNGEVDRISGLPDDVLIDILEKVGIDAADVRTVGKTSILSQRWRALPWRLTTDVSLDIGDFFPSDSADSEWVPVRQGRRHRFWHQHEATAAFTAALVNILAVPPSRLVIEKLSLKFILTKRDYVKRIGELVGTAVDAGAVRNVELDVLTELECKTTDDLPNMIGYSKRFTEFFLKDCRHGGVFRCLTKLSLQFLWFDDQKEGQDVMGKLVRDCPSLESLHVKSCGLLRPRLPGEDGYFPAVMTIDAPESRLKTLVLDPLFAWQVELVQAPALVEVQHRWLGDFEHTPTSFTSIGCTPSLKSLSLRHRSFIRDFNDTTWRLSEVLANSGGHIEMLTCGFHGEQVRTLFFSKKKNFSFCRASFIIHIY